MDYKKEAQFYNQCKKIVQEVSVLLNKGEDLASTTTLNKLSKNIAKVDPKITKNKHFQKHLIAAILTPYLDFNSYNLMSWMDFENNIYSNLKTTSPKYFSYKKITNIRGDLLEAVLLIVINVIYNLDDLFAYSVDSNKSRIELVTMGDLTVRLDKNEEDAILKKLHNQFKIPGIPVREIWGDNDIVVISTKETVDCFCIMSCKSSLRERAFQSAFWAMRSRLEGKYKHVFCTLDFGDSKNKKTEIGSRDSKSFAARKNRDVLESVMDRCYVFRSEREVPRSPVIKSLNYLKVDLERWEADFWGL